jgi:hypothetical protein
MRRLLSALLAAGLLSVQAVAADTSESAKLGVLAGRWTGTGEIREPGKEIQLVTVTLNCTDAAGGSGIHCEESIIGKDINYLASSVMGFDARSGLIHWYVVSNDGQTHDRAGQWKDDKEFIANSAISVAGKPATEDITLEITSAGAIKELAVTASAGAPARTMTLELKKSGKEKSFNPFKQPKTHG